MTKKSEDKDLTKIGEFGLINLLTEKVQLKNKSSVKGVGDDAAVVDNKDMHTIVTTDMLTEGVHFDLIYTPLKHLGYKAVIVNLSDVYAMNAIPTQIVVSIAISSKLTADMVEEIYAGIHLACDMYGVDLVGGDTTTSLTGLTISITALGAALPDKIAYRSGAKENDLVCVSGDLGGAFMGLQLLEREKNIFTDSGGQQPDFTGYEYLLERQLKPEARRDVVNLLAEKNIAPTAMIDISDGLSSEILHLCEASRMGCRLFSDKIPIISNTRKAAEEMNLEPLSVSMNGGEDYELLFTASLSDYDKISEIPDIKIIGHMTHKKEGTMLTGPDGSLTEIAALGWNPIKGS